jgi:type III secretory pathway lipoprotein EscJ
MKLINVYTTSGQLEGEMVKAFLRAQGIRAEINQESVAKTIGLSVGKLGEVQILVPENQVTEAITCLKDMEAGEYENDDDMSPPNST